MHRLSNIALVLLALAIPPASAEETAVDQLIERLSGISTMRASYTQRTEDANGRIIEESGGNIALKRPNMFRISTQWPFRQLLMSNGETFWTYDADLEQVIIRDFTESFDQMPVLLLTGEPGRIEEAFKVSSYEEQGGVTFVLEPRDSGSVFETLALRFGAQIESVSIFDSLGQRSSVEFAELELNPPIIGFAFDNDIMQRADVIDERSDESL